MGIIKTALRNRLLDHTLSALMMISINGPQTKDKQAVQDVCYRAYLKWEALKARTSQRSSGAKRKKSQYRGKPITRRVAEAALIPEVLDTNPRDEIADEGMREEGSVQQEVPAESQSQNEEHEDGASDEWCSSDFDLPEGWLLQDAPATLSHAILKKTAKVAHRFKNKWYLGKYKYICAHGDNKGLKAIYYSDDKLLYFHSLDLADYGRDKMWCVLKKEPTKKKSD